MALDPRIILSGVQADVPGAFQRGLRFADEQRQFQERRENAPLRKKAAQQAVDLGDLKIGAAERQRELFEARRGLVIAQRADTPEKWDNAAGKLGLDELVGNFPRREEMIANFEMMIEALDPSTPDEPRFFKGQRGAVNQVLPDGQGGFTFKEIVPPGAAGGGKPSLFAEKLAELEKFMSREEAVRLLTKKGGINISLGLGGDSEGDGGGVSGEGAGRLSDPDVDVTESLAVPGIFKAIINTITDAFGAGLAFPEAAEARQALSDLEAQTTIAMQDAVAGRPSKFLLEMLGDFSVEPNSIFMGEGRALKRLQRTRDTIQFGIDINTEIVNNPEGLSKTVVSKAAVGRLQLGNILRIYDELLAGFGKGGQAGPQTAEPQEAPPRSAVDDGVTPDQWQLMPPEDRALWQN